MTVLTVHTSSGDQIEHRQKVTRGVPVNKCVTCGPVWPCRYVEQYVLRPASEKARRR